MIDSHAHVGRPEFDQDRDEVLARAREAGVELVIEAGTDARSSRAAIELARRVPGVRAAVGFHPCDVAGDRIGEMAEIEALADEPEVVAIGETGLDAHWPDNAPAEVQEEFLKGRLSFGKRTGLIDNDGVYLLKCFERVGAFYQYSVPRAVAGADHDRHRRCKAERARARDDQHRNCRDDRVRQAAKQQPNYKRNNRNDDHSRHKISRNDIGQPLDRSAAALRFAHHPNDLRKQCFAADSSCTHHERPVAIDGPADHAAAGIFLDGHRLARDHRFVYRRFAFDDLAVGRHLFVGLYP